MRKFLLFMFWGGGVLFLSACLDMSSDFGKVPKQFRNPCPAEYIAFRHEKKCDTEEGCIVVEGVVCKYRPVAESPGAGPNCDAGYVTSDKCSGNAVCVQGRIHKLCRPIPPDSVDDVLPVLSSQLCTAEQLKPASDSLRIHAIDVAQGDAFWIQTPDGKNVLVDAGDSGAFSRTSAGGIIRNYLKHWGFSESSTFDAVFLTHPHSDHFGGMSHLFNHYKVAHYIDPGAQGPKTYHDLIKKLQRMPGTKLWMPAEDKWKAGESFPSEFFGPLVKTVYIHSDKSVNSSSINDASLIFKIEYAGVSVLFTGDAEKQSESQAILKSKKSGATLSSNILKVCHHGSKTSSTLGFLSEVFDKVDKSRRAAFISSGRMKFMGTYLPEATVIQRLLNFVNVESLLSTSAGDEHKEERDASGDDNILLVINKDSSFYICYSGTN